MFLLKDKKPEILVLIVGHNNPDFLLDTAESVLFFHDKIAYSEFKIAFAIDNNEEMASYLRNKVGEDFVYNTPHSNGWGRGVLRTVIHAINYFKNKFYFSDLITMDSDTLCVGPFIDQMMGQVSDHNVFFVGQVWSVPSYDCKHHFFLNNSGFLSHKKYNFRGEFVAGPCMLWTKNVLENLEVLGLLNINSFEHIYPLIHFAHDQICSYLLSINPNSYVKDVSYLMRIEWRSPLPTEVLKEWGVVPYIPISVSVIHPIVSDIYSEDVCRRYFKNKRKKILHL